MNRPIAEFYKNKNILLTGGTGFLGLGIVEKLLRAFPDVGKIYMIVRSKRGNSLEDRKKQYLENPVFSRLKDEGKADFSKLRWIEGDLNKSYLGLSQKTIEHLKDNVNMVFHGAATVSFVAPLKEAITLNVSATNDLLDIASKCRNLDCFVQISTLYTQARKSIAHLDENLLEHPIDPNDLIRLAHSLSAEQLNSKRDDYLLDWPNTYTYTKNAAENLCANFQTKFPVGIYRPGVVVHSYQEPYPYWIGKNMAFARILMEGHRGLVLDANPLVNGQCVPVDYSINGLLAVAYQTAAKQNLNIVNYSTHDNPIGYSKIFNLYVQAIKDYESILIPQRKRLLQMQKCKEGSAEERILNELKIYEEFHKTALYFLHNNFTCGTDNINKLWLDLNAEEKDILPFDIKNIDWMKFYSNMYKNAYGTKKITFKLE